MPKSLFQLNSFYILSLLSALLLLNSCYSLNRLESGRTLGRGNHEISLAGSVNEVDAPRGQFDNFFGGRSFYPTGNIGYKYGVTETADLGFRAGLSGVMLDTKIQFIGNQESRFSAASGMSFGWLFVGGEHYEFPIFTSYRVEEEFELLISPRFYYHSALAEARDVDSNAAYGISLGTLIGKEFQFGFELNYMKFNRATSIYTETPVNFTFGLNLKW